MSLFARGEGRDEEEAVFEGRARRLCVDGVEGEASDMVLMFTSRR
jgi:hypothetical protein